jgi:regulator of replication initiation timing
MDNRGTLDLTKQIEQLTARVKELENSLSIALDVQDKYQRENKKLKEYIEHPVNKLRGDGLL